MFTPHARGSTYSYRFTRLSKSVYPACAGIDRQTKQAAMSGKGLPRMRGDRPGQNQWGYKKNEFTPHARGSTHHGLLDCVTLKVYPACAGIDHCISSPFVLVESLPRMRGDRPFQKTLVLQCKPFTPHARGSTGVWINVGGWTFVYPACAGIDREKTKSDVLRVCLPRMRGDRPCP